MKVLDVKWFCAWTNVGIVRVENSVGEIGYYIGGFVPTNSDIDDAEHIANWGSHFPSEAGDILFGIKEIK